jgi:hypothetical protein
MDSDLVEFWTLVHRDLKLHVSMMVTVSPVSPALTLRFKFELESSLILVSLMVAVSPGSKLDLL